jgi:hypothetical protein
MSIHSRTLDAVLIHAALLSTGAETQPEPHVSVLNVATAATAAPVTLYATHTHAGGHSCPPACTAVLIRHRAPAPLATGLETGRQRPLRALISIMPPAAVPVYVREMRARARPSSTPPPPPRLHRRINTSPCTSPARNWLGNWAAATAPRINIQSAACRRPRPAAGAAASSCCSGRPRAAPSTAAILLTLIVIADRRCDLDRMG